MNDNQNNSNAFGDLINIIALLVGLQNLSENREQTAQNDVHKSNQMQAQYLLREIDRRFSDIAYSLEEQNRILEYQNRLLERIIDDLEPSAMSQVP